MKSKTLFRLLLKMLGVMFVVQGIAGASYTFSWLLTAPDPFTAQVLLGQSLGPAIYLTVGLYLFFGGRWVADKAIPSNRPYCPECDYDLTGAEGIACPECGGPNHSDKTTSPGAVPAPKEHEDPHRG